MGQYLVAEKYNLTTSERGLVIEATGLDEAKKFLQLRQFHRGTVLVVSTTDGHLLAYKPWRRLWVDVEQ